MFGDFEIKMGVCDCSTVYDFIWWRGDGNKQDEEIGDLMTYESFGCRSWEKNECSKS